MQIPKSQLKKWDTLREQGDLTQISNQSEELIGKKISRQAISVALKEGKCHSDIYKVLRKFFDKKEEAIKHLTA